MAVAAHLFDKEQPPPQLVQALNMRAYGIQEYFGVSARQLPAGKLMMMNTVLSYYDAIRGYNSASGQTVPWTKRNPQAWEMVARVLEARREEKQRERNGNR